MSKPKLVTLVSGGIDSTVMSILAKPNFELHPLFIDYGQLNVEREWSACTGNHYQHGLPLPTRMSLTGFGRTISSGLTDSNKRIKEDAFLPGRNALFLLMGSSFAYQVGSRNVSIGLLTEEVSLFPDQTRSFIADTEAFIRKAIDYPITIITPLMDFSKAEVMKIARSQNVHNTYSCHAGGASPCGKCISCLEIEAAEKQND